MNDTGEITLPDEVAAIFGDNKLAEVVFRFAVRQEQNLIWLDEQPKDPWWRPFSRKRTEQAADMSSRSRQHLCWLLGLAYPDIAGAEPGMSWVAWEQRVKSSARKK